MVNNNWLKILVAISAIMIAGSAAYFSVTGLGVLFSGAAVAVMVMAGSLEFAKLVTATYLKQEWDNVSGVNKWYLTSAVVILMAITSAGIFGYLSNAFQQQNLKLDQVQREIDVWNNKITYTNEQIATLQGQQKDLSTTQNTLLTKGNVNSKLIKSADNRDKQSTKLSNKINSLQDSIVVYNGKINDVKNANIGIEREVGGFRFVAEAFGVELKSVVKFFIILIVVVFDPLAVALVISFNQLMLVTGKKKEEDEPIEPTTNPEDLKNFVDETVRLRLSEDDLKKLEEALLNPPKPNEALKEAAEKYNQEVNQKWNGISQEVWDRMEAIEKQREAIHGPILPEDVPTGALANSEYREKQEQRDVLVEMMQDAQELGLYDEPFDNPMVKESLYDMNEEELTNYWVAQQEPNEELIGDDKIFSTIEPTIEDESENFSNMGTNSENFFQNEDYPNQFEDWVNETVPFDEAVDNIPEMEINVVLTETQDETFSETPTKLEALETNPIVTPEEEEEKKN